ncbi:MAG: hypothetical protein WCB02_29905 [Bradyrhizobium sp.]
MSPDSRVEAPLDAPSISGQLEGFAGASGFNQSIAQPRCVGPLKTECLTEHPGLVPASWVRWVKAIILDLAKGVVAATQPTYARAFAAV